jgi:hypothetical protein
MNEIVLSEHVLRSDTWKSHGPHFLSWGHNWNQFILRHVEKSWSSAAQQQQQQSYSSLVHCSHIARECLNVKLPGRRIGRGETIGWPPRSPDLMPLDLDFLFFGAMWKTRCTAKEWIRWMRSKYWSLQQFKMLQRTCYSACGKTWTIDEMYAELQIL